jgi:hypothetical protein
MRQLWLVALRDCSVLPTMRVPPGRLTQPDGADQATAAVSSDASIRSRTHAAPMRIIE